MDQIVLKTLISKIWAKFDLMVLRPIEWRYWKQEGFGSIEIDRSNVGALTSLLGYSFKNSPDKAFFEHRFSGYDFLLPDVLLDSTKGWVISGKKIHPLSFCNINDPYDGKKRYPSVVRYMRSKLIGAELQTGQVVWLPKLWNNYYHFVLELLPVLLALKRSGRPVTVLGCSVASYPYVQYFVDRMQLSEHINFVPIESGRFYKAQKVQLKKQPLFDKEFLNAICVFSNETSELNGDASYDKVFIYRKGMRSLKNNQAVLNMLSEAGFFCFDPGDHPVDFQVSALKHASVVVGVHGAGLTNVLFSNRLKFLLELMPLNMKPNHYREIAVIKGAAYECLQGSNLDDALTFTVEPSKTIEALSKLEN
jgi:hypothetical protein